MKTVWTKGKNKEEVKDIKSTFLASLVVRKRLQEILAERLVSVDKSSPDDYETPSWALKQADKVGFKRALQEIYNLLE